jgi:hypothetical protein
LQGKYIDLLQIDLIDAMLLVARNVNAFENVLQFDHDIFDEYAMEVLPMHLTAHASRCAFHVVEALDLVT